MHRVGREGYSSTNEITRVVTALQKKGHVAAMTAVQILYANLATDGLPALALAVDPPEADLMHRSPRNPRGGIFSIALCGPGYRLVRAFGCIGGAADNSPCPPRPPRFHA